MDRRKSPSRAGFTLVELLVVIVIIATLIAILLPAIRGAYRKAQEAQVGAELNNLATALASFKTAYGDYPPSRIVLCEAGYNNSGLTAAQLSAPAGPLSPSGNDTDITLGQLIQRSRLYLRRFWPRVDFDNGSIPFNFNNNGSSSEVLTINGSECLTFFLGGMPLQDGNGGYGMTGFSKLPLNPFLPPNPASSTTGASNRSVPNYEFNTGRLVDLDGDGIPSYLDPLDITPGNRRSYAYFCAYGSNSYDPNDVNGLGRRFDSSDPREDYEQEDPLPTDLMPVYVERGFTVAFPTSSSTANYAVSPGPNPYCTSTPVPATGTVTWINPNSFQLFSAGPDRLWGLGGTFVQNSLGSTKLTIASGDTGIVNARDTNNNVRNRESDNLSNFSSGRLE